MKKLDKKSKQIQNKCERITIQIQKEDQTKSGGRLVLSCTNTKFPLAKSKGVPLAAPPNTPPRAPSYTNKKNAEIIKLGNSANGRLITLKTILFVKICNCTRKDLFDCIIYHSFHLELDSLLNLLICIQLLQEKRHQGLVYLLRQNLLLHLDH